MNKVEAFGKALVAKVPEYQHRKAELETLTSHLEGECLQATRYTIEGLRRALDTVAERTDALALEMVMDVAEQNDGLGVCFQEEVVEELKALFTDAEKEATRELYSLAKVYSEEHGDDLG